MNNKEVIITSAKQLNKIIYYATLIMLILEKSINTDF